MHSALIALLGILITLIGCGHSDAASTERSSRPAWIRGATCYEIFVRSFYDSDGDGVGDLNGIIQKLDYINDGSATSQRDLGARCIWLMPVAESPSYHGYDVADYYRIDREYGTNDDFKRLIAEAHRRGIRVIVDMVLNHASSEHPAFKEALRDPASPSRALFRWSATDPGKKGPWGQALWHRSPVRDEYYYGIFWHEMPDLNYETPAAREEAKRIATFWLREMGADGFRLDAVPYLIEEGDVLRDTPATNAFMREYGAHVRSVAPESFTVGEVWDSVGAMLPYYPDQLDSYFAFELSEALLRAVRTGNARAMFEGYLRLQRSVPDHRFSTFLRNHDQTRTMTALGGDARRVRVATTLLFTLPGTPFVYYGEEIGMTGDKPDERLRTPMQWSGARGAGFTSGRPWQALQSDSATAHVAAQEGDSSSLLALHRHLIHLRSGSTALAAGELVALRTADSSIVAFLRGDSLRPVLVLANLSSDRPISVRLTVPNGVLPAGRYAVNSLAGESFVPSIEVASDGAIRESWVLQPYATRILELSVRR